MGEMEVQWEKNLLKIVGDVFFSVLSKLSHSSITHLFPEVLKSSRTCEIYIYNMRDEGRIRVGEGR